MLVKLLRTSELADGARVHRVGCHKDDGGTPTCAVPKLYLLQEVHGRTVTVLQYNSKVYAIDTACFHQGGPLGTEGDIEEISGVACLRCPWHGYRV